MNAKDDRDDSAPEGALRNEDPSEPRGASGKTAAAKGAGAGEAPPAGGRAAANDDDRAEADDDGDGAAADDADAEDAEEPPAARPRGPSMWDILRDSFFTFDRRTLGFTRILLGFFLIGDLFRRSWAWSDMFADIGVLPNHVNLWRPQGSGNFSLVNAFSTPGELWVLWVVIFATYVCLLIGWKTKLMQVLSLVFVTSMNGRVLLIENGGYVVHNLLLLWTCFLPLGDRFSLDALLASLKRSRERTADDLNDRTTIDDPLKPDSHVTVLGPVLLIQIAAIYFFNVVHKTGPAWKNGTAIHYVLYVDRMVTPIVADVRDYAPKFLILFMTKMVISFEAAIPVCLLSPVGRAWARRLTMVMMNVLHIGFGMTFVLGPFAWALCVMSTLLFGREDWEIAARTMRRAHRARVVLYDPRSPGAVLACRVLKRMDRFGLLTFEASSSAAHGLSVRRPDGALAAGAEALADIIAAIPLGPTVAWALRLPLVRDAVTAAMAAAHRRSLARALGVRIPERSEVAPPPAPLRLWGRKGLVALREIGVLVMFVGAVNQAAVELWVIKNRWKLPHPEPTRVLAQKLRFLQGWFMFSPNPVMDDGTIVVDAVTVDGRHIDPFTGKPPNFDLLHAQSFGYTQIWCDYFARIKLPANTTYRDAMKEYMYRYPERTGRPEDAIVSGDVYWVKDWNPKWGSTESYGEEREKLFSFQNPKAQARAEAEPPAVPGAPGQPGQSPAN
ncbi:HTTM domain-containing protein [Sorangium sp. So ce429]